MNNGNKVANDLRNPELNVLIPKMGILLRRARYASGFRQTFIAKKLGLGIDVLYRMEYANPIALEFNYNYFTRLVMLAKYYGFDIMDTEKKLIMGTPETIIFKHDHETLLDFILEDSDFRPLKWDGFYHPFNDGAYKIFVNDIKRFITTSADKTLYFDEELKRGNEVPKRLRDIDLKVLDNRLRNQILKEDNGWHDVPFNIKDNPNNFDDLNKTGQYDSMTRKQIIKEVNKVKAKYDELAEPKSTKSEDNLSELIKIINEIPISKESNTTETTETTHRDKVVHDMMTDLKKHQEDEPESKTYDKVYPKAKDNATMDKDTAFDEYQIDVKMSISKEQYDLMNRGRRYFKVPSNVFKKLFKDVSDAYNVTGVIFLNKGESLETVNSFRHIQVTLVEKVGNDYVISFN